MERKVTLNRPVELIFNGQPIYFPAGECVVSEDMAMRLKFKAEDAVDAIEVVPPAVDPAPPAIPPAPSTPAKPKPASTGKKGGKKGDKPEEPASEQPEKPEVESPDVNGAEPAPLLTEETQPPAVDPLADPIPADPAPVEGAEK